ncbi:hypothetical protein SPFL3102_01941 [Sporomusaceae bacterium FL31]|nr:hypothetical protein SPFL3101_03575 [Sporomusaceae bacterium FL31]GCE34132.1 hypothetical protein SPFL3102_01941 [Sporomusaceae bacterium]
MQSLKKSNVWSLWMLGSACLVALLLLLQPQSKLSQELAGWLLDKFSTVHVIFFSIIVEALPFVLIGVLGAVILEALVTPEFVRKILPKSWLPGILITGLLGVFFPFCECGLVPIVKKLIEKGVPTHLGVVMLLTVPIVNPIVGAATNYAFFSQPDMVVLRLGGAYVIAVIIGLITLGIWQGKTILSRTGHTSHACSCGCDHGHGHHSHRAAGSGNRGRFMQAINHGQDEFFSIMRYLAIGALLAAITQVYFPREWLNMVGTHTEGSVGIMMVAAFFLSICSGADAFVANTFANTFTNGAIVAFLVYGPMIDLKNFLMLRAVFKSSFVLYLLVLVSLLAFGYGVLINYWGVMR